MSKETKGPNPIVGRHHNHTVLLCKVLAVIKTELNTIAEDVGATEDPKQLPRRGFIGGGGGGG